MCRWLGIVLTVVVASLTPVAHASPPDQTWIAGLYDDADYDDAILAVVASVASVDAQPSHDGQGVDAVPTFIRILDERPPAALLPLSIRTRAPPLS
jgi:hypothetical protein